MVDQKNVFYSQVALALINFIAICYYGGIFYFGTQLAADLGMSQTLLENLAVVPMDPHVVLSGALLSYFFLLYVIYRRENRPNACSVYSFETILELVLMFANLYFLQFSYNGVILLVMMDVIYGAKEFKVVVGGQKNWAIFVLLSLLTFFLSEETSMVSFVRLPSIEAYIHMYPKDSQAFLSFGRQMIFSINLIAFMICLLLYILLSVKQRHEIEQQLQMASQANRDLESYLALSEKIAEDRERKRIAREIHDTLGHALTGISAGIDAVTVLMDRDVDLAKQQLGKISRAVREGIRDVRRSLAKMRPGVLENASLEDALKQICEEYQALSYLDIHLLYEWGDVDFDVVKEDALFRVIQETITNSVRHGHGKNLWIHCYLDNDYHLLMRDDGVGCDHLKAGFGLKQMEERVMAFGGKIKFYMDKGFVTDISLPKD
ncbi:sensor histidine kinase [Atopobacter sp. AH10]|uniref:sensor histidine kinase n=1 Tax=Atopobacter sp. AH10 TaxID=2315861 RepID=UPI000EF20B14|nr:sensor histidine kinase [Atopobacter sp. AH10]RLK64233.1 sensor histidine kinase [Atopobacter sp. AH10]